MQRTILWTARVIGTLWVLFILYFLIAHVFGVGNDGMNFRNNEDIVIFVLFPITTIVGLSVAWKWEGIGGLITVLGNIALLIMRPDLLTRVYLLIPLLPGLLFLIYAIMIRRKSS